jgi:hypothetical protein
MEAHMHEFKLPAFSGVVDPGLLDSFCGGRHGRDEQYNTGEHLGKVILSCMTGEGRDVSQVQTRHAIRDLDAADAR